MTLRELHYLVALADKQNFGRAAESCHVGQPTLSMQLKKLEDYEVKLVADTEVSIPTASPPWPKSMASVITGPWSWNPRAGPRAPIRPTKRGSPTPCCV